MRVLLKRLVFWLFRIKLKPIPRDISWEEAMKSKTNFFDVWNKLEKASPNSTDMDRYHQTITLTDGICFHPPQFLTDRLFQNMVETYPPREDWYGNGDEPFHRHLLKEWYCPICGYHRKQGAKWTPRKIA